MEVINGFSAHAGQDDLVGYAEDVRDAGPLRHVALVHGEDEPRETLKRLLEERGFPSVLTPARGERLNL